MARQRKAAEDEKKRIKKLHDNEVKKVDLLKERANDFITAKAIYEYVEALMNNLDNCADFEDREQLEEHIRWVRDKADWLNPLVNKEDPILGKKRTGFIDDIDEEEDKSVFFAVGLNR